MNEEKDIFESQNKGQDPMYRVWESLRPELGESETEKALKQVMSSIVKKERRISFLRKLAVAAAILLPVLTMTFSYAYVKTSIDRSDVKMLQCFAQNGEVRKISLPDGSSVSLNAGSTLIYPDEFKGKTRNVYLQGEAVFNVAHDAKTPFVVGTADFDVQVLGTVFNVDSYPENDYSSVVLSQGSVKIVREGNDTMLEVGQKAEFSRTDHSITVDEVSPEDYLLWEDGYIILRRASIREIADKFMKSYGIALLYPDSEKFRNASITATFDPELPKEKFLDILSRLIPGLQYTVKEDGIWLE